MLSFSLPVSNIWRYWEKVGTGTWPSRSSCKSRTKSRWFRWNHIFWHFKGSWSCCRWWQPPCWASTARAGNQWRPSTRRPRLTRGATRFLAPVRLWNKKVLFFRPQFVFDVERTQKSRRPPPWKSLLAPLFHSPAGQAGAECLVEIYFKESITSQLKKRGIALTTTK